MEVVAYSNGGFLVGRVVGTEGDGAWVRYLVDRRVIYWHECHLEIADAVSLLAVLGDPTCATPARPSDCREDP